MAISPQYLRGDPRPVEVPFDTSDATITYAVGDLIIFSSNFAAAIGSGTVTTAFIGVSAQKKKAAETTVFGNSTPGIIRVDSDGVHEFDTDDTVAINFGDLIGPNGSQKVKVLLSTQETISIGRCAKTKPAGTIGRVQVKINSSIQPAAKAS